MRILLTLLFLINFYSFGSSFEIIVYNKHNQRSSGVGFPVEKDGIVMTSYHVVEDVDSIITAEYGGNIIDMKILGYDEILDVALLKTDVIFEDSSSLLNDDISLGKVITINYPKKKIMGSITSKGDYSFQTDIAVSQGYSGSPVLCGVDICGIVTSFNKETKHAIATSSVKIWQKYHAMLEGKIFQKKNIEFLIINLTKNVLATLEMDVENPVNGVLVTDSKNHNLQAWDIITHVNNHPINNVEALQSIISSTYSDEQITFNIIRKNKLERIIISPLEGTEDTSSVGEFLKNHHESI